MNNIEVIVCLVLLFMAVPDLCRKLGRPALVFPVFVLFGLMLGPVVNEEVYTMLRQAGQVGFLLLLFEVGLEIDLPRLREFLPPLRRALLWALLQYPLIFGLATLAGFDWPEAFLVAAALTGCSVGMAHPAWKQFPGHTPDAKALMLQVMVALEMIAIVLLSVEATALKTGWSWLVLAKFGGIGITIFLIARFAAHVKSLFQTILERATHWRLHWLVLLVLGICAVGERLGLDAAKTAFFLGLALSRARHEGLTLEEHIAPISHRFLIPVFFVALGMQIEWSVLADLITLLAVGSAGLLLGFREILHRRWFDRGGDRRGFLLWCPNLTMVALAAKATLDSGADPKLTAWLLLTGLFTTVPALMLLPAERKPPVAAPAAAAANANPQSP